MRERRTAGERFRLGDSSTGFVYFIEMSMVNCVKIGYASIDPLDRLEDLQAGCPVWLELIAVVESGARRERWIQNRLSCNRVHREWFAVTPFIRQVIDAAIGMMRPENAAWCRGGEEYERWDDRRKRFGRTIEDARNSELSKYHVYSSPIDILTEDMDFVPPPSVDEAWEAFKREMTEDLRTRGIRHMVPHFFGEDVEPFQFQFDTASDSNSSECRTSRKPENKSSKSRKPLREPKPGHFDLIDRYRAERKQASSRPQLSGSANDRPVQ